MPHLERIVAILVCWKMRQGRKLNIGRTGADLFKLCEPRRSFESAKQASRIDRTYTYRVLVNVSSEFLLYMDSSIPVEGRLAMNSGDGLDLDLSLPAVTRGNEFGLLGEHGSNEEVMKEVKS
jgi:hypothetical protein